MNKRQRNIIFIHWMKAFTQCLLERRAVTLLNPEEPVQPTLF